MNLRLSLVGSGRPGSHVFGAEGGAFGRSQKCDWVLPDDERILSSVHGRLVFRNGDFMLVDESTNGIFVNGLPEPLGRGNSIVLTNGTRFNAGRYTIEAHLVPTEASDAGRRTAPGRPVQPMSAHRYHDTHAVPMAGRHAEDALGDRTELGSLFVQNSQDPLSYMDDAVDAGIGGSLDRAQRGRDPLELSQQAVDPLQSLAYGSDGNAGYQAYAPSPSPQYPQAPPIGGVSAEGRNGHDPLSALGYGQAALAQPAVPPAPMEFARAPQPPRARPSAQPAVPLPGGSVIPEDFLSQFGAPRKAGAEQPSSSGFRSQAAPAQPISQPLPQRPSVQSAGPAALIPEGFDLLSVGTAQKAAGRAPVANPFAMNGPVPQAGPIPTASLPPPAPAPPAAVPLPPAAPKQAAGPAELPSEPRTSVGNASIRPERPASPRPGGLSPALMADIVEFGGQKDGSTGQATARADGALDTLEALKARREQRKAAMLRKAQSGGSSLPLPSMPQAAGAPSMPLPAAAMPAAAPATSADRQLPGGSTNNADDTALVTAFLEGMGFPDATPTPSEYGRLMRDAGAMVRAMATGLILLLSARKMVKSEFRMDETQVQPEENNPFKFFKVAELALDELFLTRNGGFQAPAEAARSAFDDLEQHTVLTMSAMQRAIKLIFERLSPSAMTGEADDQGGLRIRGLGARKGKLEAFVESHERMSRNIDSIARQVIGEAFAQVLEEHARNRSKEHWEKRT